jgi:hypothetical protein
MAMLDLKV